MCPQAQPVHDTPDASQIFRWTAIATVDMATEVMAHGMAPRRFALIHRHVPTTERPGHPGLSFRLPLTPLPALRLSHLNKYPGSSEPQFSATNSVLFLQTMVLRFFISATVPNLKNFIKSFSIGIGLPVTLDVSGYG